MHVGQGGAKEASDLLRSTPSMTDRRLQEPTEKGFIRSSKKAFLSVYLFVLWFVTAVPLFTNLGKIMHQAEKKKKQKTKSTSIFKMTPGKLFVSLSIMPFPPPVPLAVFSESHFLPKREAAITAQNTVTYLLLIVPHLWGGRQAHCLSFVSRFSSSVSRVAISPCHPAHLSLP